jgi:hypothetical protein
LLFCDREEDYVQYDGVYEVGRKTIARMLRKGVIRLYIGAVDRQFFVGIKVQVLPAQECKYDPKYFDAGVHHAIKCFSQPSIRLLLRAAARVSKSIVE